MSNRLANCRTQRRQLREGSITFGGLLLDVGLGGDQVCNTGLDKSGESSAVTSDEFLELGYRLSGQLRVELGAGIEEPWE